jgi:ribonuclease HI
MKELISVHILGQLLPNGFGGIACYAYVIRNNEGYLLHESCGLAADPNSRSSTSNIANYTALIKALEWLIRHRNRNAIITVKSSSKFLISHLDESYCAPDLVHRMSKSIVPLHKTAMKLKTKFYKLSFEFIGDDRKGIDSGHTDIDRKGVEELTILAYLEAKEKILLGNNTDQKTPFIIAAQLMKH